MTHKGFMEKQEYFDIYCMDVGLGNATMMVTPSGKVLLYDTGGRTTTDRILKFAQEKGIKGIDYLIVSHFEEDHMGATAGIAAALPILNFVDKGTSFVYGHDNDWWMARRHPFLHDDEIEFVGQDDDRRYDEYCAVRGQSNHILVKCGDTLDIDSELLCNVVCANGEIIRTPMYGNPKAGEPVAEGVPAPDKRMDDDTEDSQSMGMIFKYGEFRLANLADLTWNLAGELFYPINMIGEVDACIATHHTQSIPRWLGEYFHCLSGCSEAEAYGLNPRAMVVSLGAKGHRVGDSLGIDNMRKAPRLDGQWQTEYFIAGGQQNSNAPKDYCAYIGGLVTDTPYIHIRAKKDGSFSVTNSRNGFTKQYER